MKLSPKQILDYYHDGKKFCFRCQRILSIENFHNNKTKKDGLASECIECRKSGKSAELSAGYRKKYKLENVEKVLQEKIIYKKKRLKNDVSFKALKNLRCRLNKAIGKNIKKKSTIVLIGCSLDKLKKHLESQFKEGMNWDNYGLRGWHIDHIIPCSHFDLSTLEGQLECFHYTNLQPLWAIDNLQKSDKIDYQKAIIKVGRKNIQIQLQFD